MPAKGAPSGKPRFHSWLGNDFPGLSPAANLLVPNGLKELYRKVVQAENQPILETLLAEMKITLDVAPADLARIPSSGATVVVANHPFGMLDGIVLGALALRARPDVKILANSLLAAFPGLVPYFILIDPFQRKESRTANAAGLRQALAHLRSGGMLIIFPAGEVASWQFADGEVSDPPWNDTVARLVCATQASVLPVLFMGTNSLPFHLMGLIHPMLRTVRLPHELLNKFGKQVELRIGHAIPAEKVSAISGPRQATDYLRWRTFLLANRQPSKLAAPINKAPKRPPRTIAAPVPQEYMQAELAALGSDGQLCENREFAVYSAGAAQIPSLLAEIGRQREITFREVGEGTGKATDTDRFDAYYTHLILWSKVNQELAGAYRLAATPEILADRGIAGLYTSSLFRFDRRFFEKIGPALELGRSFIRKPYQRQHAALLMLWKGIAHFVARRPEIPTLFGAVSISNSYKPLSRELIVRFFESRESDPLAKFVAPKASFAQRRRLRSWELSALGALLNSDELSESIAEIEPDGKGIPVLLKHYLRVGGKILAFNVDKNFSDSLDGLILVDLRKSDPSRMETYMSKAGWQAFSRHHGLVLATDPVRDEVAVLDRTRP